MADLAELKQMVLSFRVSELHVLLGFAGRNKSGRKQELTQRALSLVQKACSLPVQIKIRELYRQIYPVTKSDSTLPSHKDNTMPVMHRHTSGLDYSAVSMRSMIPPQANIPVNPDVKLRHLPFYDVLAEVMKPSSLIPKNNGRMQETLFVFHLTPQQAQDITMSRDFRPGAKCEYTVQVQVRFCLLETSSEQADIFPSQIQVRVNNKPATLPNIIPTNKPNVEAKRPGRPVDITSLCRLSPTVSNAITVTWAADFTRSFCMSVYLVRKLTSDILLARLRQFGNRHSDHTKALIKDKLVQDPDSEIATTSLRVSLMCPLGKMRMQIPCRASICTHLQCFDASTFLMMNERKPTWMCPVCDRPCPYDKLIIDGYFVDIFLQSPLCSDIIFHEDGTWSPMKAQKESHKEVILSSSSAAPKVHMLSLTSSLSASVLSHTKTAALMVTTAPPPAAKPASAKGPVIDLTLDSSDDDDVVIPSDPVSPQPVINLDTPSPATNLDTLSPILATSLDTSCSAITLPSSPTVVLPTAKFSSSTLTSHPPSLFTADHSYSDSESQSSNHSNQESSLSAVDSILSSPSNKTHNSSSSNKTSSSPSSTLQTQALNLEAMSDADFDEFLKGLSWGV
uniref:Protein inhibitor of activated STAT n=1 Tax=Arion vulgaris TaxID=1028688 RepID=A0A0B7A676_9EUPU